MLKLPALALAMLLTSTGAPHAAEKPTEIEKYIHAEKPYGEAQLRRMMMVIYDADLWTDAPQWSWQRSFALTLHYHMGFDGDELSERSIQEIDKQSPLSRDQSDEYADRLNGIFPNVQSGDEITALYLPGKETRIFYNGQFKGAIKDKTFAKRFLSIWLGEKTSEPSLRQQLLALSDDEKRNDP